jgi:hypothetical protein
MCAVAEPDAAAVSDGGELGGVREGDGRGRDKENILLNRQPQTKPQAQMPKLPNKKKGPKPTSPGHTSGPLLGGTGGSSQNPHIATLKGRRRTTTQEDH